MKKRFALLLALLMLVSLLPGIAQAFSQGIVQLNPDVIKVNPDIKKHLNPDLFKRTAHPVKLYAPVGDIYHAMVKCYDGYVTVWEDATLSGNMKGRLLHEDVITVQDYTYGASKILGGNGSHIGYFVSTSFLVEIPDEAVMEEGGLYKARVSSGGQALNLYPSSDFIADPLPDVKVHDGAVVYAQNYDNGISSQVWLSQGVSGFIRTEYLVFLEDVDVLPDGWR